MMLDKIFWDYGMELLAIHHQVKDRKFRTTQDAKKHFIQAVKDRVRSQMPKEKSTAIEEHGRFIHIKNEQNRGFNQYHTEMDKAVEKL